MYTKYPKNFFLSFLGFPYSERTTFSYYRRPPGSPIYWERIARKIYTCSLCGQTIIKGERYIGCKILELGFPGIYRWRSTYVYSYYHIHCLLKSEETKLRVELNDLISRLKRLKTDYDEIMEKIKSFKQLKTEFRKRTSTAHLHELAQIRTYDDNKLLRALCPKIVENEIRIKNLQQRIHSINIKVNIFRHKIKILKEQIAKARIKKENSSFWRKLDMMIRYYLVRYRISKNILSAESQISNLIKQSVACEREIIFAVKSSEQYLEDKIKKLEESRIIYQREIDNLKARIRYLKIRLEEFRKLIEETSPDRNKTMRRRKNLRRWRLPGEI